MAGSLNCKFCISSESFVFRPGYLITEIVKNVMQIIHKDQHHRYVNVELWRVLKLYTLYSPLSDKVVGKNTAVKEINTTCYTDGWLFKFKVTDKTEVCQLMTEAKYQEFLKSDATAKQ